MEKVDAHAELAREANEALRELVLRTEDTWLKRRGVLSSLRRRATPIDWPGLADLLEVQLEEDESQDRAILALFRLVNLLTDRLPAGLAEENARLLTRAKALRSELNSEMYR